MLVQWCLYDATKDHATVCLLSNWHLMIVYELPCWHHPFLSRDSAMLVQSWSRTSVRMSHACFVTKPNNALWTFWYHTKGQLSCYSDTNSGWWATPPYVWNFSSKWPSPLEKRRLPTNFHLHCLNCKRYQKLQLWRIGSRPQAFQWAIDGWVPQLKKQRRVAAKKRWNSQCHLAMTTPLSGFFHERYNHVNNEWLDKLYGNNDVALISQIDSFEWIYTQHHESNR